MAHALKPEELKKNGEEQAGVGGLNDTQEHGDAWA